MEDAYAVAATVLLLIVFLCARGQARALNRDLGNALRQIDQLQEDGRAYDRERDRISADLAEARGEIALLTRPRDGRGRYLPRVV